MSDYAAKHTAYSNDLHDQVGGGEALKVEVLLQNLADNATIKFGNHTFNGKQQFEKFTKYQVEATSSITHDVKDVHVLPDKIIIVTDQTFTYKTGGKTTVGLVTIVHKKPGDDKASGFEVYGDPISSCRRRSSRLLTKVDYSAMCYTEFESHVSDVTQSPEIRTPTYIHTLRTLETPIKSLEAIVMNSNISPWTRRLGVGLQKLIPGAKPGSSREALKTKLYGNLIFDDERFTIFEHIKQFDFKKEPRQIDRQWVPTANTTLKTDGDTWNFPLVSPDFTLLDISKGSPRHSSSNGEKFQHLWRHRSAFAEIKPNASLGPVPASAGVVKDIVAQSADYARLHMSAKPFQLFTYGLLIFGSKFCVAIYDRDGVLFSPTHDMWHDTSIFVRIIRRFTCDLSDVQLGRSDRPQAPRDGSLDVSR
ncbi:hypothetical protein K439DRAFT_1513110 [Ramaria rubella]|nr:hypothetical protein K439DRAFT_1513110 [Ramaria rubella]